MASCYPVGWVETFSSADASGCEEIKAAPAAGLSYYLEALTLTNTSGGALAITVGAGETAGAVTTALFGPMSLANGAVVNVRFTRPIIVGTNAALTVDADGAGQMEVVAQGFTQ